MNCEVAPSPLDNPLSPTTLQGLRYARFYFYRGEDIPLRWEFQNLLEILGWRAG